MYSTQSFLVQVFYVLGNVLASGDEHKKLLFGFNFSCPDFLLSVEETGYS